MTLTKNKQLKILLIDDSDVDAYVIEETLNDSSHDLIFSRFDTPTNAFDFLTNTANKSEYPDIVLLDLSMPYMDGFEFLNELEDVIDLERGTPFHIFILTSSNHLRDIEKFERYPQLISFLRKPLDLKYFDRVLKTIKEGGELNREPINFA